MGILRARASGRLMVGLGVTVVVAACTPSGNQARAPPGRGSDASATSAPPTTRAPLPVPAAYAGFHSDIYADPAHWVCRPDKDDICDHGLDATVVAADGTLTPEPFVPAADAPIDCFYIYPT